MTVLLFWVGNFFPLHEVRMELPFAACCLTVPKKWTCDQAWANQCLAWRSQCAANWSALDIPPSLLCPFSELTCSSAGHSQDTDSFPPPTPTSLLFLYLRHFSSAIETWLNPSAECSQVLGSDTLRDHPQPIRDESLWTNHLLASLSPGGRILTYVPHGAPEGPTRPALQLLTVVTHSLTPCWLFSHLVKFLCPLICAPLYPFPNTLPAPKALSQGLIY